MKSKIIHIASIIAEVLIISMWTYTGLIKILTFAKWKFLFGNISLIAQYKLQFLIYVLPVIELFIPLLFIISVNAKKIGAIFSSVRLSNFIAHKTLLILCCNGKENDQQKAS